MKKRNKYWEGSLTVSKNIAALESEFNLDASGTVTAKGKIDLGKGFSYTRGQTRNVVHGQGEYQNILEKKFKSGTKVKAIQKPGFFGMEISKPI